MCNTNVLFLAPSQKIRNGIELSMANREHQNQAQKLWISDDSLEMPGQVAHCDEISVILMLEDMNGISCNQ